MPNKMDWDSPIANDGASFELIEADKVVEFEVVEFTKARTKAGEPMAKLKVSLFDGVNFGQCYENLVLSAAAEWKLCAFFIGIGQRKHGEEFAPDWDAVEGAKGFGIVKVRSYTRDDGEVRVTNEIGKFLEPDDGALKFSEQGIGNNAPEEAEAKDDPEDNLPF